MSSTVLSIGQDLADEVGVPRQTNLVGNPNQVARRILLAIKDAVLTDVFRDHDWEMLKKEGSVSLTGGGVTTYSLPADFDRIVNGTVWDEDGYRRVRGPVDLREWSDYNKGLAQLTGLELVCRIVGDPGNNVKKISFYPDTDAVTVSFYYISNRIVLSAAGELQSSITSDGDSFLVDDPLARSAARWRLLRLLGMDYSDERNEYMSLIDDMAANDSGSKEIQIGRKFKHFGVTVPDVGYGS